MQALDQHRSIVLQFSGGKDSLATLYLCKPWWDKITVAWVNSGSAYPETIELMQRIKELVPNFVEIRSQQPEQIEREGWPIDVVPIANTAVGQMFTGKPVQKMQDYVSCCSANIWKPMQEYVGFCGATLVIRGQRNDETRTSPVRSGDTVDGIEYLFPVENWTETEVLDYLAQNNIELPKHYEQTQTSLDCWNCTAYTDESAGRYRYTEKHHPVLWGQLKPRLETIYQTSLRGLDPLRQFLGKQHG